ncbi:GhoT/OrtT family toxin [Salmonella enterica]|nr:GhoT/OrtT family toxin [Salmonella enterica subsp. diarizonae serovar 48:i:z]EEH1874793.1 GhoT/OrtT family toxin [Salmonella enterica]EEM2738228.1 GhoT/OrtT family toxin [Salmonella enterica]EEM9675679.1 GhoT/OrtT family toxin [Salmonella enterica]EEN5934650.1 GhoT/OrtT family toxin [Salmonella enterica]
MSGFISGIVNWFISYETRWFRILSTFLIGTTWSISFPVALLFSLL